MKRWGGAFQGYRIWQISAKNRHPRACPEDLQPHGHQYFTNKINGSAAGDPRDKPEDDGFYGGAAPP